MSLQIVGVAATPFVELYGLCDAELAARNARRYVADASPGFPDRTGSNCVTPTSANR